MVRILSFSGASSTGSPVDNGPTPTSPWVSFTDPPASASTCVPQDPEDRCSARHSMPKRSGSSPRLLDRALDDFDKERLGHDLDSRDNPTAADLER
jgi:hypothetical protein